MNTHSRYADGRREVFAAHAGMAGANQNCICQLMEAPTADQCLAILEDAGLREPVLDSIFKQILYHTRRRADGVQVRRWFSATNPGRTRLQRGGGPVISFVTKEGIRP